MRIETLSNQGLPSADCTRIAWVYGMREQPGEGREGLFGVVVGDGHAGVASLSGVLRKLEGGSNFLVPCSLLVPKETRSEPIYHHKHRWR